MSSAAVLAGAPAAAPVAATISLLLSSTQGVPGANCIKPVRVSVPIKQAANSGKTLVSWSALVHHCKRLRAPKLSRWLEGKELLQVGENGQQWIDVGDLLPRDSVAGSHLRQAHHLRLERAVPAAPELRVIRAPHPAPAAAAAAQPAAAAAARPPPQQPSPAPPSPHKRSLRDAAASQDPIAKRVQSYADRLWASCVARQHINGETAAEKQLVDHFMQQQL